MTFVIQQHLSRGSATPCCARTMIQTGELVGAFALTPAERTALTDISHSVMLKLVACVDAAEPLLEAIRIGKQQVLSGNIRTHSQGHVVELPSVVDLSMRAEAFLGHAKQALREITRLFLPLHGRQFDHRFQKVVAWAKDELGENDPLTVMLVADADWVAELVSMRNAVEHPGSSDGTLEVKGFTLVKHPDGGTGVGEPSWVRSPGPVRSLEADLLVLQDNLLRLFEDILVDGLLRRTGAVPFTIVEIPESERNPEAPVRFRVALARPLPAAP